ncbi:MAG: hypothetical protein LUF28_09205 [Clostridiales bacterium]|nr:hypothetical protein [Clostridiales bacterium]
MDWTKIKTEYITTNISQRALAAKYGVSKSTLAKRSSEEQWVALREECRGKIEAKSEQKSAEKIIDAVSDTAAIKARLERTFWNLIEQAASELTLAGTVDPADLRRVVQCYVDMRNLPADVQSNEEQHNALMAALREAAKRED